MSEKLDVERMTGKIIYIAYPSGQVSKLTLYYTVAGVLFSLQAYCR